MNGIQVLRHDEPRDYCPEPGGDFTFEHCYVEKYSTSPVYKDISTLGSMVQDRVFVGYESESYLKCIKCGKLIYD